MRKTLLVLIVAMSTLLWMGRAEPAYAKTLACQGSESTGVQENTGAEPGTGEFVLASFTSSPGVDNAVALIGGNAALWSVSINGSRFTGGNLTTTVSIAPASTSVYTCFYTLDSASSFISSNGTVQQTLIWDPVSSNPAPFCSSPFTDHVYLVANGAAAVMIDDNLSGEDVPGSGTCVWL